MFTPVTQRKAAVTMLGAYARGSGVACACKAGYAYHRPASGRLRRAALDGVRLGSTGALRRVLICTAEASTLRYFCTVFATIR